MIIQTKTRHPNEPTVERLKQIRGELAIGDVQKKLAVDSQIRRLEKETKQ